MEWIWFSYSNLGNGLRFHKPKCIMYKIIGMFSSGKKALV